MTKAEQARVLAWRLKILRWAADEPRQVARTCRHFGISRTAFYRWKRRFEVHGEAGLGDRPPDAAELAAGDPSRGGEQDPVPYAGFGSGRSRFRVTAAYTGSPSINSTSTQ